MVSVIIPMIRKISSILIILSICISVNAQVSDENTILEIEEKTDQEGNGNNKKGLFLKIKLLKMRFH